MDFEPVIGLEVHVELATQSKMFCSCSTAFGAPPNTQVCPVCLGLPGVLPVTNRQAINLAIKAALAFGCKISSSSRFARKSYFYPDLPKNYQISQYEEPLATEGSLEIASGEIGLRRIHLEEDAGKLIHAERNGDFSLIDFNRAGIPLMEIVTQPALRSPEDAVEFLQKLRQVLRYLEISDCSMEEGSLRCDANVSVRKIGEQILGTKVEVKNLNSFRSVRKALTFEIDRQTRLLLEGKEIFQETRLWNENRAVTETMRGKEEAHDYRYFPEPDLRPLMLTQEDVDRVRSELVELPEVRKKRFIAEYHLSSYEATVLTAEKEVADYFETATKLYPQPKILANWIMGELAALVREEKLDIGNQPVTPSFLAELAKMVENGIITRLAGKDVLRECLKTGRSPATIVSEAELAQVADRGSLEPIVLEVITENKKAWNDFQHGTEKALGFLMGQVMRKTKGRANPKLVEQLIREHRHGKQEN
ncbi:MAG: Asp-tRNA(Asn)/Glu-tRNA(Gln) amidotransferase subunit GatB [Candidatus Omnitrophica bacterium]|nr:Asp-tRNA(Asn)/Glu-tRNA(Gln) amidotransferase subunit GatB [Candidatus Omnitrophota bacterium]